MRFAHKLIHTRAHPYGLICKNCSTHDQGNSMDLTYCLLVTDRGLASLDRYGPYNCTELSLLRLGRIDCCLPSCCRTGSTDRKSNSNLGLGGHPIGIMGASSRGGFDNADFNSDGVISREEWASSSANLSQLDPSEDYRDKVS